MRICSTARISAAIFTGIFFFTFFSNRSSALVEFDPDGLVRVSSTISTDSVTVGQRFRVRHTFEYPDSLKILDLSDLNPGSCRVVSLTWREEASAQRVTKTADVTLMTLDLEKALFPEMVVDFETPAGDTVRVFANEIVVPVRHVTTEGAAAKPLKEQWDAPRSVWKWIVAGAAALLAAAALVYWWRRRKQRVAEAPPKPKLPADYVALTELTRIEKLDLLAGGQFKKFYSLVTRAIRAYIEDRFRVDALDRTTRELLRELEKIGERVERLEDLLKGADLVKFAEFKPGRETAAEALTTARKIVVTTAPKAVIPEDAGNPPRDEKTRVQGTN